MSDFWGSLHTMSSPLKRAIHCIRCLNLDSRKEILSICQMSGNVKSRLLAGPSLTNHIGTHNMDKPPSSHSIIGKMDSIYMYEGPRVFPYILIPLLSYARTPLDGRVGTFQKYIV